MLFNVLCTNQLRKKNTVYEKHCNILSIKSDLKPIIWICDQKYLFIKQEYICKTLNMSKLC